MEFHKFKYPEDFEFKNKRIILTDAGKKKVWKTKKITGSRFGGVLGVNEYQTPFQTWCDIFGFYKTESDSFFTDAGTIIEPKLRDYAATKLKQQFLAYEPSEIGYDAFKDNKIFGGMPDGEPLDPISQKINYDNSAPMLEIKTASIDDLVWTKKNNEFVLLRDNNNLPQIKSENTRFNKWVDQKQIKIPQNYLYQLGLYLYLRNTTKGIFCIGFLKFEDYLKPEQFDLNKRLVLLEEFEIDLKEFQKAIDYATQWYDNHVTTAISPEMNTVDLEWFAYGYPEIKN